MGSSRKRGFMNGAPTAWPQRALRMLGQFLRPHDNSNSTDYTMRKYSLRGNQQYEIMKLVLKYFS